jgi:hypothetical protein
MDTMIRGGGRGRGRQGEASDVVGGASSESGCTAKEERGQQERKRKRKRFVLPVMSVMSVANGVVFFFCQSILTHYSLTPARAISSYRLGACNGRP